MTALKKVLALAAAGAAAAAPVLSRGVRFGVALPGQVRSAASAHPRRTLLALTAAVVMFTLASGGFLVLSAQRGHVEAARAQALATAERSVSELLSYDYRSLPTDIQDRQALVTGKFKTDYTGLVTSMIAPAAARAQLLTRSNVGAAGVVDNEGTDQVTVLMFVNQTTRSAATPDPQLLNTRIRVTMLRQDGHWLVSDLQPV